MKVWLYSIVGGVALVPLAIVIAFSLAYWILYLRRVGEYEGKRGFLAALYGGIFGGPAGFYIGFKIGQECLSDDLDTTAHRLIMSGLLALLVMSITFIPSLIGGVRMAEARRANCGGEQAAWSFFYIALPITLVMGATTFFVAWRMVD